MSNYLKYGKLQENPSKFIEATTFRPKVEMKNKKILTESDEGLPKFILPKIEAIHAGRTRNFNNYPANKLAGNSDIKSGVHSFISPYPKPVIYNHDTNTAATGRIESAAFSDYTEAGRAGIIVIPKITDKEAIRSVLDKRLLTVSIGGTVDASTCNICGTDIVNEGFCGHWKGEEYDGKTCEWIAGNIWFDELSWVNVPADEDAMVVDTQSSLFVGESKAEKAKESASEKFGVPKDTKLIVVEYKKPNIKKEEQNKMTEEEIKEMQEKLALLTEENKQLKNEEEDTTLNKDEEKDAVKDNVDEEETKDNEEKETKEPEKEEKPKETEEALVQGTLIAEGLLSVSESKFILSQNKSLTEDLESLQDELKGVYINSILELKEFKDDDKSEEYKSRLEKRALSSLKDLLEDLKLESELVTKESKKESETTRTVKKVNNPLKESVEKTKEEKEGSKLELFTKMLTQEK